MVVPILAAVIGALLGAFAAQMLSHRLSTMRDQDNAEEQKAAEDRQEFLIAVERHVQAYGLLVARLGVLPNAAGSEEFQGLRVAAVQQQTLGIASGAAIFARFGVRRLGGPLETVQRTASEALTAAGRAHTAARERNEVVAALEAHPDATDKAYEKLVEVLSDSVANANEVRVEASAAYSAFSESFGELAVWSSSEIRHMPDPVRLRQQRRTWLYIVRRKPRVLPPVLTYDDASVAPEGLSKQRAQHGEKDIGEPNATEGPAPPSVPSHEPGPA